MNTQERSQTPECMEKMRAAKETRSASTLSECSQNRGSYCTFSGLGDCPNNLILPFPSPEKMPTRIYEGIPRVDYCGTVRLTAHLGLAADPYRIPESSQSTPEWL